MESGDLSTTKTYIEVNGPLLPCSLEGQGHILLKVFAKSFTQSPYYEKLGVLTSWCVRCIWVYILYGAFLVYCMRIRDTSNLSHIGLKCESWLLRNAASSNHTNVWLLFKVKSRTIGDGTKVKKVNLECSSVVLATTLDPQRHRCVVDFCPRDVEPAWPGITPRRRMAYT